MSPDLRRPPEPVPVPLTDAELVDAPREVARILAAQAAEPPAISVEDEERRLSPYGTRLFALQARVIASPAETLRGCVAKLRVIFDPDNGPCAGNTIEPQEFAAIFQVVEVIEQVIMPPAIGADAAVITASREALRLREQMETEPDDDAHTELMIQAQETAAPVWATPVSTLAGAASVVRCLIDRVIGIDEILDEADYQAYVKGLAHVLAAIERAPAPPPDNADAALFGIEQQIADLRVEWNRLPELEEDDLRHGLLDQIAGLDVMMLSTPVQTMAGAACVLRRLLDPIRGVGAPGSRGDDLHAVAVQYVLAAVEPWVAAPPAIREPILPSDGADVALLEAEREVDQLLAATEERPPATDDDPGFDRLTDRNQFVLTTPAATLAGAAAKLRRVLCPLIGLPVGDGKHDIMALTQALAVVEREVAEADTEHAAP